MIFWDNSEITLLIPSGITLTIYQVHVQKKLNISQYLLLSSVQKKE